jgi:hypothetical protein
MSQYLVAVYKRNLVTPRRSCRVGQHVATNHMNKKKRKKKRRATKFVGHYIRNRSFLHLAAEKCNSYQAVQRKSNKAMIQLRQGDARKLRQGDATPAR